MKMTWKGRTIAAIASAGLLLVGLPIATAPAQAATACGLGETCNGALSGKLGDSPFQIRMPAKFNGTVLLYSHGYRFSGPIPAAFAGPTALALQGNPAYTQISNPAFTAAFGSPVAFQANNNPEVAPAEAVAQNLLAQGYALAGAGYARQGWAAAEGVEAGENLIKYIRGGGISGVKNIRTWGPSLGALISASLAERNPRTVQSSMPFCGAMSGPIQAFSNATTVLFTWKQLIDPTLKAVNYTPGAAGYVEALTDLGKVFRTLGAAATTPASAAGYPLAQSNLLAGLMAGLPTRSTVYDGQTVNPIIATLAQNPQIGPVRAPGAASAQGYSPVTAGASSAAAMLQNVGAAAALGILGRYDLEMRAREIAKIPATDSANFNDNVNVSYAMLLAPEQRAEFEDTLNASPLMPNPLNQMLGKLDSSLGDPQVRWPANPAAVAAVEALPAPKGSYTSPTVLMTTTYDPATPEGNTGDFMDRLRASWTAAGSKGTFNAVAYYTVPPADGWTKFAPGGKSPDAALSVVALGGSGVGHCVFTGAQVLGALSAWSSITNAKTAEQIKVANRRMWQVVGVNGDGQYDPPPLKKPKGL
jgi:hypothetical protein